MEVNGLKLNRLLSVLIIITLILGNLVYAEYNVLTESVALKSALENSNDILKYSNAIKLLERDYREAVISSRSMKEVLELDERLTRLSRKTTRTPEEEIEYQMLNSMFSDYMSMQERLNLTINSELSASNVEYMLNINRNLLQSSKNNTIIVTYTAYNELSKTEDSIKIKKALITNMENNFSSAKLKYSQGKISKNDLNLIELNIQKAKIELNKLLSQKEKNVIQIHKVIGLPLDNKYSEYKNENIPENITIDSLQEYIDMALINREDIKNAKKFYEIKQKEFEITKQYYYFETNVKHKEALVELSSAENELETIKLELQLQVMDAFNRFESQLNNQAKTKISYNLAETKLKEMQNKQKLGLITEYQLSSAYIDHSQSHIQYLSTTKDTWLAKLNLDIVCGIAVDKDL